MFLGLSFFDPRLNHFRLNLDLINDEISQVDLTGHQYAIDKQTFCGMLGESKSFLHQILSDKLAIREFTKFVRETEIFFNSSSEGIPKFRPFLPKFIC